MDKVINKEFEGNVKVTISDNEVRLWVCKEGISIFRFKFFGKVYGKDNEIVVFKKR